MYFGGESTSEAYSEKIKMDKNIEVIIDGKKFPTILDDQGVQRFPVNGLYRHLVDSKQVDLNRLSIDFQKGLFSREDYMEFYRGIGYSVCGFLEIFEDAEIQNPLWEQ